MFTLKVTLESFQLFNFQEEELDDLAGQVQMLEQSKTKLEMSMAAMKKEHRREVSGKEDELEDARAAAQKKVKALEQQLESEHEERIGFVREKHDLETKIMNLQDMASRSADEEQVSKLKKDLKRTKALLKDAQVMIERGRNESSNKSVLRQLKNQVSWTNQSKKNAFSGVYISCNDSSFHRKFCFCTKTSINFLPFF